MEAPRLSTQNLNYSLAAQKFMIWLKILPTEVDETYTKIWLPDESSYWSRRGVRNLWIGYIGSRILVLLTSLISSALFGSGREVKFYELTLDYMVFFVISLLLYAYCHLVVYDLPSQTILSNQTFSYVKTGKVKP